VSKIQPTLQASLTSFFISLFLTFKFNFSSNKENKEKKEKKDKKHKLKKSIVSLIQLE